MLETWEAQRLERIILSGRTRPLVIECSRSQEYPDDEGSELLVESTDTALCVVKGIGLPEVTDFGLFCEVFGNLLARELGIDTPFPCLVHLSELFTEATNPILARENLRLRPGMAAGCDYFAGGYSNVVTQSLSIEELKQATLIYAYDLLVQNPDRTEVRPNCAVGSEGIKVYDFETSFSFILLIGSQDEPWEVSKHGLASKHLFHSVLKRNKLTVDWRPFVKALKKMNTESLNKLAEGLPHDWLKYFEKVRSHLLQVVANAHQFELELRRSLS